MGEVSSCRDGSSCQKRAHFGFPSALMPTFLMPNFGSRFLPRPLCCAPDANIKGLMHLLGVSEYPHMEWAPATFPASLLLPLLHCSLTYHPLSLSRQKQSQLLATSISLHTHIQFTKKHQYHLAKASEISAQSPTSLLPTHPRLHVPCVNYSARNVSLHPLRVVFS